MSQVQELKSDNPYRRRRVASWTRIDMLLALYDAAIRHINQAQSAQEKDDANSATWHILRGMRCVMALKLGLNADYGELPQRINQLCDHVKHALVDGSPARLESAARVMAILREGFDGIREEAIELEAEGVIPPVENARTFEVVA